MARWKHRRRFCITTALLALGGWATSAGTQVKPGIEIRGTVIDAIDNTPVEGVSVTLIRRVLVGQQVLNEMTVTDDRGAFALWAPSVGEYSLSAAKLPLAFGEYGRDPFVGSPRWFSVSGRTTGIIVRLWKAPQVRGRVLDENSQPLAGVTVRVIRTSALGDGRALKIAGAGSTGVDGTYSLRVLSPGWYLLAAVPRLSLSGPARPVQYHPGVTHAGAAAPIELVKGRSATVDFRLSRWRGFTVGGIVELPSDANGSNSIDLFDVSDPEYPPDFPVATSSVSDLGAFSFPPVPAGSYEIRFVRYAAISGNAPRDGAVRYNNQRFLPERLARVPEGQTWWAAERITVLDRDVTLPIQLIPGVRVSGRVVFTGPGDKPDPAELPNRGVYLRSVDHRFFRPYQVGSVGEDGTFETVSVPPGKYVLGVLGPFSGHETYDGYQLESVRIDGREVSGAAFDLSRNVRDAVLTFSSRPTILSGTVSGVPGEQRCVLIWPDSETLWTARGTDLGRFASVLTVDGPYSVPLFPGSYRLVALEGVRPWDWDSTDNLRRLLRVSEQVTVLAGQTTVRNLRLGVTRSR